MALTIYKVVTQFHQEVITLKAQVGDQTGLAEAVRAINTLSEGVISLARERTFSSGRRRRRRSLLVCEQGVGDHLGAVS